MCCWCCFCSGAPTKEYTYPYSMMHRRLTTAGIEVVPHYHKCLQLYDAKLPTFYHTTWYVKENSYVPVIGTTSLYNTYFEVHTRLYVYRLYA